ncbi:hypothetical protein ACFL40_00565 [candidate division KSB1 bacterium]
MKCKSCIFIVLIIFLGAIFVINRITEREKSKTRVYVQGAVYIDYFKDKKHSDMVMENIFRQVDPDILIMKQPVTFYTDFWSSFVQEISPAEKDSIINNCMNSIYQVRNKLGFDILPLKLWDMDVAQARKRIYSIYKDNPGFQVKVESYKEFNKIISQKIEELNLKEDVFVLNVPMFDMLKEIETDYFTGLFDKELGSAGYDESDKRYIDKIEELIQENRREKIMVMYNSNLKHKLIKRLEQNDNINVIRVAERKKK